MVDYKTRFLEVSEKENMLRFGSHVLKSQRRSPHFFNMGDIGNVGALRAVGECYAECIAERFKPGEFNCMLGPAYKGISLASAAGVILAGMGFETTSINFNRKEAKSHGEQGVIIGHQFQPGDKVLIIDDVFTTGDTKQEMIDLIKAQCPDAQIVGILIGLDRKELDTYGENAIKRFRERQGIRVEAIASVDDLVNNQRYPEAVRESIKAYLQRYGVDYNREAPVLIGSHRSIIPALDFGSQDKLVELVKATGKMDGVGAYKLGFSLGLRHGLPKVVEVIRKHSDKPIIYDGQKAGTDIPDTGEDYAAIMKEAGVNAAILFPMAGRMTQERWTEALWARGVIPIVGGEMTHPRFKSSEGGYIDDNRLVDMYINGARQQVRHFVAPGNKMDRIAVYREQLMNEGIAAIFISPGFVAQSNTPVAKVAEIAGPRFHAVVGRGIYEARDMGAAAERLVREINQRAA